MAIDVLPQKKQRYVERSTLANKWFATMRRMDELVDEMMTGGMTAQLYERKLDEYRALEVSYTHLEPKVEEEFGTLDMNEIRKKLEKYLKTI